MDIAVLGQWLLTPIRSNAKV